MPAQTPHFVFRELTQYLAEDYEPLRLLMEALTQRTRLTPDVLQAVIAHPDTHLYVARHEGRIVACATLALFLSPTGRKASVEDVVVMPDYRGRGLGRALMQHVLREARRYAPVALQLTSRPSRVAANALYRSLGFEQKDTNFYKLKID